MGGNIDEWNDLGDTSAGVRGRRGGAWSTPLSYLSSSVRHTTPVSYMGETQLGFRVASSGNPDLLSDFVFVGDVNNDPDTTGYGSVDHPYYIGKYEVTNGEYTEFLNSIATNDTYSVYNLLMGIDPKAGIARSGVDNSYVYYTKENMGNKPVNVVSWFDCARYCNWLHNSKPTGLQDNTTTEDGAYTISGDTIAPAKNIGAKYYIPTENEWYKAAYYKGSGTSAGYWKYPTQSDFDPLCVSPDGSGNGPFCDLGNVTGLCQNLLGFDSQKLGNLIELSNSNRTATYTGDNGTTTSVLTNYPVLSGDKIFFSVTIDINPKYADYTGFGLANDLLDVDRYLGSDYNSIGLYDDGLIWINRNGYSVPSLTDTFYNDGDIVDMAVDRANNLVWFRVNGNYWNSDNTQDPVTALGGIDISYISGTVYPAVSPYGYDGIHGKMSINCDTSGIPSGFIDGSKTQGCLSHCVNLLSDANFDTLPKAFFANGQFGSWTVNNVDIQDSSLRPFVNGKDPNNYKVYIDLNSCSSGWISQTINTLYGRVYDLSFNVGANPNGGVGTPRTMKATVLGADSSVISEQEFSISSSGVTNSYFNLNWARQSIQFIANGSETTIKLSSTMTESCFGPIVDCVEVCRSPIPPSCDWDGITNIILESSECNRTFSNVQFTPNGSGSWEYSLPVRCGSNSMNFSISCDPEITLPTFDSTTCSYKWSATASMTCGSITILSNDGDCTNTNPPFFRFNTDFNGCPPPTTDCCPASFYVDTSKNIWQDTGIDVGTDCSLTITATGSALWGAGTGPATPDGIPSEDGCFSYGSCSVMSSECHMKLIGKIGEGEPFGVGSNYIGTPGSGRLYLMQNDACAYDNSGLYAVDVTINCTP
jgi:hypothetical protein